MTGAQLTRTQGTGSEGESDSRGTYVLIVCLDRDTVIQVGRLGQVTFPRGWYLYAGSALGPGGLAARLARHRRDEKRPHWHVDHLLAHAALVGSWHVASPVRLECAWAEALRGMAGASVPAAGFGASDCRCETHLLHLARRPSDARVRRALIGASPPGTTVRHERYAVSTGR